MSPSPGRLIELGKLDLKTSQRDKREAVNSGVRKIKNKSGIIEMRAALCAECGEEYCDGRACLDFNYDLYVRVIPKPIQPFKGKTSSHVTHKKLSTRKKSKSFNEHISKGKHPGKRAANRFPTLK